MKYDKMTLNIVVLCCILLLLARGSLCFDFEDLKNINSSCFARGRCRTGRGTRLDTPQDWKEVNCFCDEECNEFGDCCLEARSRDPLGMKEALSKYECIDVQPFGSYYMRGLCLQDWAHTETEKFCLQASPESSAFHDDPFLDMPVTSLVSGITYKNYYCAVCNDETDNLEVWQAQLSCPDFGHANFMQVENNVQFVNDSWGLYQNRSDGSGQDFLNCDVFPAVKETVIHKIRRCKSYLSNCSSSWTDATVKELCQSYTTLVYGPPPNSAISNDYSNDYGFSSFYSSTAYRNYHCAMCNYINPSDIACYERNFRQAPTFSAISFSVLFDFGEKNTDCEPGEIWDPFSKTCRAVVCVENNSEFRGGRCVKIFDKIQVVNDTDSSGEDNGNGTDPYEVENSKLKCDKLFLNESDFTRGDNGSVIVNIFRRTYDAEEYHTYKEGILVCIPDSYSRLMGWLTLFGLGLSSICLVIHLITFLIVPDLRNLSGKNLASMCFALLVAYICFLITSFKEYGTNSCPILASVMYYGFLASFCWMNVMAFDIWRTLQMATSELRLTTGKQWKKFIYYSIYAWTLPLLALITVLLIDYLKPSWIEPSFLPEFGKRLCWFGQRKAILIYFAAPLATIMLLNIFFFVMAVKMVAQTAQSSATLSSSQPHQVQLKLFLRLALLMGLSWISGILAGYIQEEYMWYIFILLNAFQGIFVLLAFTCTKKVIRSLKGTSYFRKSYKGQSRNTTNSRQALDSQDSNHSHLSNTSSSNLTTVSTLSKSSGVVHSP